LQAIHVDVPPKAILCAPLPGIGDLAGRDEPHGRSAQHSVARRPLAPCRPRLRFPSAVALDVTTEASWAAAVATAGKQFGKLDILANNAGMFLGKDLMDASMEDWSRLVAINMTGVWLGTKLCAPALAEAGKSSRHGSAIVNLASVAGIVGSQLDPLYSMTKGGVTLFTKSAALSFARKGWKIRVNSIHPGVIETDMGAQTFVSRARQAGSNDVEAARSLAMKQHPIGRLGVAEDIALGIVFLASDDAGFMTGSGMVVDGGLTAQ
jgi:NAD(P)-dependent dehydrogenase (short-subunit alcohol dehydrogenase family)